MNYDWLTIDMVSQQVLDKNLIAESLKSLKSHEII